MVRAILDGRKTQTRRVVKFQEFGCFTGDCPHELQSECDASIRELCPYGQPGDRLWAKETFYCDHFAYPSGSSIGFSVPDGNGGLRPLTEEEMRRDMLESMYYRADGENPIPEAESKIGWRPSIFMPRWASRITLEITAIRAERLQDISEEDALKEGSYLDRCQCMPRRKDRTPLESCFSMTECHIHGMEFKHLWKSINGPVSWDANPFVWVIEFKKL